jgi:hypothetical protein
LVVTSVAMTGLAKMVLNSFVMLRGSTIVTCRQRLHSKSARCNIHTTTQTLQSLGSTVTRRGELYIHDISAPSSVYLRNDHRLQLTQVVVI